MKLWRKIKRIISGSTPVNPHFLCMSLLLLLSCGHGEEFDMDGRTASCISDYDSRLSEYDIQLKLIDLSLYDQGAQEVCYLINSLQELEAVTPNTKLFDFVDFTKYSMVIGRIVMDDGCYTVSTPTVKIKDGMGTLELHATKTFTGGWPYKWSRVYWIFFPKMKLKQLTVDKTTDRSQSEKELTEAVLFEKKVPIKLVPRDNLPLNIVNTITELRENPTVYLFESKLNGNIIYILNFVMSIYEDFYSGFSNLEPWHCFFNTDDHIHLEPWNYFFDAKGNKLEDEVIDKWVTEDESWANHSFIDNTKCIYYHKIIE